MSQFGMQMPGARPRRGSTLDVYAAMMGLACVCLAAACVFMYQAASKVGRNGNFWELQSKDKGKIELRQAK